MASTSEYASDGTTLTEIINELEAQGYTGEFKTVASGSVQCLTCQGVVPAGDMRLEAMRRTEGASDPGDMAYVAALRCPSCDAQGTAVLRYGPEAPLEDADVLAALEDVRPRD